MKLVSLKIKIRKALKVLRKHWRKITLGSFLLLIVAVVGFVSDVLGLKSYFSEKILGTIINVKDIHFIVRDIPKMETFLLWWM